MLSLWFLYSLIVKTVIKTNKAIDLGVNGHIPITDIDKYEDINCFVFRMRWFYTFQETSSIFYSGIFSINLQLHFHLYVCLRLPSGWLSLDRSVLDLVAQSVGVGKRAEQQSLTSQDQESHLGPTEQAQTQNPPTRRQAPR